jgi:excisionase family DNA binding protein
VSVQQLPGFYTLSQVAEASGLSLWTIKREVKEGRLKARYIGKCRRVRREDYVDWMESLPTARPA